MCCVPMLTSFCPIVPPFPEPSNFPPFSLVGSPRWAVTCEVIAPTEARRLDLRPWLRLLNGLRSSGSPRLGLLRSDSEAARCGAGEEWGTQPEGLTGTDERLRRDALHGERLGEQLVELIQTHADLLARNALGADLLRQLPKQQEHLLRRMVHRLAGKGGERTRDVRTRDVRTRENPIRQSAEGLERLSHTDRAGRVSERPVESVCARLPEQGWTHRRQPRSRNSRELREQSLWDIRRIL